MSTNGKPPKDNQKPARPERELEPWEADPSWSSPAREAFECYRDQGTERSTASVARALGKTKTLMDRWSRTYAWVERAAAWDAECDRVRREEFIEGTADVARAQATTAAKVRLAVDLFAQAFLNKVDALVKEGKDPFDGMTPTEMLARLNPAARALLSGVQVERLARGMSTQNVAGHDGEALIPDDIAGKSDAQIEAYLMGHADAKAGEREESKP